MKCKYCKQKCIRVGKQKNGKQKYRCKSCEKYQQRNYKNKPKEHSIIILLKEGCGIRSIARLLHVSPTTVQRRILKISSRVKAPPITKGKEYEIDEMCTYVDNKNKKRWIAYSLRRDTKEVVNFVLGTRTKRTISQVTNSILLSEPKMIYTDKLNIYKGLLPEELHSTKQYSINHIERNNLTVRTHLKRLNRRTICYSKSALMLSACLRIYFWG
ncbi:MAG: IS1 family transposase [Flavobacteriales bacterium]